MRHERDALQKRAGTWGIRRKCCYFFCHRDVLKEKEEARIEGVGGIYRQGAKVPTERVITWDPEILCIPECSCAAFWGVGLQQFLKRTHGPRKMD